jgi:hypothetical protein
MNWLHALAVLLLVAFAWAICGTPIMTRVRRRGRLQ